MKIYVDAKAGRDGNGSSEMPFRHINDAAQIARPGDEVLVAPGVYREYVNPKYAGTEDARITYRSTEPLGAVIRGTSGYAGSTIPYSAVTILTPPMYTETGILPAEASIRALCI